jgi:hypothetical protein
MMLAAVIAAASPAAAQGTATTQAEMDAMALFRARQAARQAEADANSAAARAGLAQGLQGARKDAREDQFKMVNDAVRNWKQPRGYTAVSSLNASALQDPFAATAPGSQPTPALQAVLGASGLAWDEERKLARVAIPSSRLCDGRLLAGDYPTLADGSLLDTPDRITRFLSSCADRTTPLMVVVGSGDIEVRK